MERGKRYQFPRDRWYDRDHHMWAQQGTESGRVAIGIDAFGLDAMGDLAYITLARPGALLTRGRPLGTMEAAKMTGDIVSPLSGVVTRVNHAVVQNPGRVNADPYSEGWLLELAPSNLNAEKGVLVSGDAIDLWSAEEERTRSQGWNRV